VPPSEPDLDLDVTLNILVRYKYRRHLSIQLLGCSVYHIRKHGTIKTASLLLRTSVIRVAQNSRLQDVSVSTRV
jgi:hypothetical protein